MSERGRKEPTKGIVPPQAPRKSLLERAIAELELAAGIMEDAARDTHRFLYGLRGAMKGGGDEDTK